MSNIIVTNRLSINIADKMYILVISLIVIIRRKFEILKSILMFIDDDLIFINKYIKKLCNINVKKFEYQFGRNIEKLLKQRQSLRMLMDENIC